MRTEMSTERGFDRKGMHGGVDRRGFGQKGAHRDVDQRGVRSEGYAWRCRPKRGHKVEDQIQVEGEMNVVKKREVERDVQETKYIIRTGMIAGGRVLN